MQLPRGTFYAIRKGTTLPSLLAEAAQSRFSGSMLISSRTEISCLVILQGQVILAEHRHLGGDSALQEIQQYGDRSVDAEWTMLSDVQMKLALEFNKGRLVSPGPGSSVLFTKKEPAVPETGTRLFASKTTIPVTPRITDPGDLETLVNGDLEALDRIDLEKMAGKMRVNAMAIANKLDLDHLVNG